MYEIKYIETTGQVVQSRNIFVFVVETNNNVLFFRSKIGEDNQINVSLNLNLSIGVESGLGPCDKQ